MEKNKLEYTIKIEGKEWEESKTDDENMDDKKSSKK